LDQIKLINRIKKIRNLSTPSLHGITFHFLKHEKEAAVKMIVTMMKIMLKQSRTPSIWKIWKPILFFKL
jgi:hypothetical protein